MTISVVIRRGVVCAALTVAGVATIAVPASAEVQTRGPVAERRLDDPLALQAAGALLQLDRLDERTATRAMWEAYVDDRDAIAAEAALRAGVDPARMQQAWAEADMAHQTALLAAFTQLGVPYRRNTSQEGVGFDCSGLTTYAWARAGHQLTRQSGAQINEAAPRTQETAQAGDLIHYPGHVSIWLGVDQAIIHSPYTGRHVEVDTISRSGVRYGDPTA